MWLLTIIDMIDQSLNYVVPDGQVPNYEPTYHQPPDHTVPHGHPVRVLPQAARVESDSSLRRFTQNFEIY